MGVIKFLIGLALFATGGGIVVKTEWMLKNFGRIQYFEEKLGAEGGSRLGYKLVGLLIIFVGVLLMTGLYNGFMEGLVSPLTKFNPQ